MEGQEDGSGTAAPSSVAQEGLLALPTPEQVGLTQPQKAGGQQQQTQQTAQRTAAPAAPVNSNRVSFHAVHHLPQLYHTLGL